MLTPFSAKAKQPAAPIAKGRPIITSLGYFSNRCFNLKAFHGWITLSIKEICMRPFVKAGVALLFLAMNGGCVGIAM